MSMMRAAAYGLYRLWGSAMDEREPYPVLSPLSQLIPCMLLLLLLGWLLDRTTNDRRLNDFIILNASHRHHLLAYVHVFSGHMACCSGVMLVLLLRGESRSSVGRQAGSTWAFVAPVPLRQNTQHFSSWLH